MKKTTKFAAMATITAFLFSMVLFVLLSPITGTTMAGIVSGGTLLLPFTPLVNDVIGMNNTNNMSARESFRIARELLFNAFKSDAAFKGNESAARNWVNSRKLSQSEIRLEVELNTTSNSFVFGLTANQQNSTNIIFNTEQRLNMQDTLIASEYAILVGKPASQTSTAWQARTYGNTQDFTAAAAAALDSTFYSNGNFSIACNNDVIMPYRGLWNHLYRGQTQQTAALGAGSPGDQIRGAEDGYITMEPNILLIGSKQYQPQINLKSSLAACDANTRAVLIFRGILAQNSTSVS